VGRQLAARLIAPVEFQNVSAVAFDPGGAALAVESALLACAEGPRAGDPDAWLRLIFAAAREQITARALADGNDADDYATTLAVAILTGEAVAVGSATR
jgi:hypothetical protein